MLILQLLYFMLPAYFANMAPVFARQHLEWLNIPLDGGKKWRGKPILGSHKTLRGVVSGVVVGVVVAAVQYLLLPITGWLSLYSYEHWILLGLALSFGALLGDILKSFFKRQIGVKSGKAWVPFDQIDYAVGALAIGALVYFPGWLNALYIVLLSVTLHFIVNAIGFALGIRKQIL
ncbi:CDP-archaeol synthase [Candidatus Woesearchaeota archaeon]|nr:CDP-archaeol synthase [Candidatus Woesearchaeota archaeon]